jgi:ABC-type Fe3+-siderophore transport system permease subunit
LFRRVLLAAPCALALAACAHTVTVVTEPPGAWVTVDGQELGRAPVSFREQPGTDPHRIEVRPDGQPARQVLVERTELAPVAIALGFGTAALTTAGCLTGALLGNPLALAGLCGGFVVSFANVGLGCQSMCAGLSLCLTAPTVWTVPAATAGGALGLTSLGALWWLGQSPDLVTIEVAAAAADPG